MKKWQIVLNWRRQLKEWGDYDNSLGGTIAELWAVEEHGMIKAPMGTKAYDGHLNNRKLQVKAKDSRKLYTNPDTQHYAEIKTADRETIDDILLVFVTDEGITEHYLFDVKVVEPRVVNKGKNLRYVLKDIKAKQKSI